VVSPLVPLSDMKINGLVLQLFSLSFEGQPAISLDELTPNSLWMKRTNFQSSLSTICILALCVCGSH